MDRIPPPNLVCPSGEPCHPLPIWGSICGITAGISVPHPLICWSEVDHLCFMTFIRKCVVTSKESIRPAVCLPSAWLLGHPVCHASRASGPCTGWSRGVLAWGLACGMWELKTLTRRFHFWDESRRSEVLDEEMPLWWLLVWQSFFKKNFYRSIIDLQCVNFCCIAKWLSYTDVYIFFPHGSVVKNPPAM